MKIIYGCYPSFFSRMIANKLIENNIPITHIMVSTRQLKIEGCGVNGITGLKFIVRRFGYKYALFQIFCGALLPIIYSFKSLLNGKRYLSFEKLCARNNIELIKSDSFNDDIQETNLNWIDTDTYSPSKTVKLSEELVDEINENDNENIVKITFFNHIKQLCLNIHPSDIPNFGGVEPIIQLLLSSEYKMGITIHKMTEILDDGEPIMRQYTYIKNKSYLMLMFEFIEIGIKMLSVLHNNNWVYKVCKPVKLKYPYRSWPTREELKDFSTLHSYVKFRDLFNLYE